MKRMGMTVEMETDDFEAAAAFISQFGKFVQEHNEGMTVRINGSAIDSDAGSDAGDDQTPPDDAAAMAQSPDMVLMDMMEEPGRFAFEEEG